MGVYVVLRHETGFVKELRLFADPKCAAKVRNKMSELYLEDSVDMREQEVE